MIFWCIHCGAEFNSVIEGLIHIETEHIAKCSTEEERQALREEAMLLTSVPFTPHPISILLMRHSESMMPVA